MIERPYTEADWLADIDGRPAFEEPESFKRTFDASRQTEKPTPLPPLEIILFSQYVGLIIPERQFIVPRQIPSGVCTLLSGDGGIGKTVLMQQLQTAGATGGEWCGIACEPFKSIGFFCEDSKDELLRRQRHMNNFFGIDESNAALLDQMPAVSRLGQDNFLMVFDSLGRGELTAFFKQIRVRVLDEKYKLLGLDCLVEMFGGDENRRPHVRQFMSALNGLASEMDGAVLLNAHPSASGLSSGSGTSGSTDWSNAARSRLYFSIPKADKDGAEPDEDARILTRKKANYAKRGYEQRRQSVPLNRLWGLL